MTSRDISKSVATSLLALLLLGSLFLVYQREGLLPWGSTLLSGVGLMLMMRLRGRWSLYCSLIIAIVIGTSWTASVYYVYSSWESGEVIDITVNEDVTFRTLVVEKAGDEVVIYDCPPEQRAIVESSKVASIRRGAERYQAEMRAVPVDFSSDELVEVYGLYQQKYANQGDATDAYYLLIGPRRGSQLYVLYLTRRS